ncbi:hypothetical protein B9L19_13660 [Geobacillus thermocatenulatus]|uniref:RsgI N-terminal anti-sigma domain-containing protein n=1 Tax=Geobacillus thermocatenulatus TaxID=33938 RepID=A0AA91QKV3_9BACL|nr:hypothetical protein B9L19_13660 [Geobacillus thermocatenulatus]
MVHGDKRGAFIVKKGIVLELGEEFVTVLTPEGEFLRLKKEKERSPPSRRPPPFESDGCQNEKSRVIPLGFIPFFGLPIRFVLEQ